MQVPTQSGPTRVPVDKSVGVAFVLTFFFGPFGLLYASVLGGLLMMVVAFLGLFTLGLGTLFAWVVSIVWGCVAASRRHSLFQAWLASGGVGGSYSASGPREPSPIVVRSRSDQVLIAIAIAAGAILLGGALIHYLMSSSSIPASSSTPLTSIVGTTGNSASVPAGVTGNSGTGNSGTDLATATTSAAGDAGISTTTEVPITDNALAQEQPAEAQQAQQQAAQNIESAAEPIPDDESTLTDDEDGLTNDETGLASDVTSVNNDLSTVKNDLVTVQDDVSSDPSSVCGDAGSLAGDVSSAEGDQSSFSGDVNSDDSDLTGLENDQKTLTSDWSSFEAAEAANPNPGPLSGLPSQVAESAALSQEASSVGTFNSTVSQGTQQIAADIASAKQISAQAQTLCQSTPTGGS